MTEHPWLSLMRSQRVIAVIRASTLELGTQMAKAVAAGGIKLIEVTWNSHQAAKLIHQLRLELPTCTIGAGTLLTTDHLWEAIAAGAEFLFSPHLNRDMIQAAVSQQVPIVPGALSPTEIVTAWQAGATAVKVFPIQSVGGAAYIQCLQGPLGHIPLIPTGGVTLENAKSFIEAGAIAIGLSSQLFPAQAVQSGDWDRVARQSKHLVQMLS
ncbi:MAG: bifunctional 4-hydroxy-2-oxoglutarate aldolase/2-dehydro-3-deoxy-phosphogluconate aldolase [Elainellaceae cyanobacterium]